MERIITLRLVLWTGLVSTLAVAYAFFANTREIVIGEEVDRWQWKVDDQDILDDTMSYAGWRHEYARKVDPFVWDDDLRMMVPRLTDRDKERLETQRIIMDRENRLRKMQGRS